MFIHADGISSRRRQSVGRRVCRAQNRYGRPEYTGLILVSDFSLYIAKQVPHAVPYIKVRRLSIRADTSGAVLSPFRLGQGDITVRLIHAAHGPFHGYFISNVAAHGSCGFHSDGKMLGSASLGLGNDAVELHGKLRSGQRLIVGKLPKLIVLCYLANQDIVQPFHCAVPSRAPKDTGNIPAALICNHQFIRTLQRSAVGIGNGKSY